LIFGLIVGLILGLIGEQDLPTNKQKPGEVLYRWWKHSLVFLLITQPLVWLGSLLLWFQSTGFDWSIPGSYLIAYQQGSSLGYLIEFFGLILVLVFGYFLF